MQTESVRTVIYSFLLHMLHHASLGQGMELIGTGINPLSIPGSSLTSPSPDQNTHGFFSRYVDVDSVSPSGPSRSDIPGLSSVGGGGVGGGGGGGGGESSHNGHGQGIGGSRGIYPSSSGLHIDPTATTSSGPGSAGSAGPSTGYNTGNANGRFNFESSDPALRGLYSASPDFAFNMGYQQPHPHPLQQQQQQHRAAMATGQGQGQGYMSQQGPHRTPTAGPSRGGSSGSVGQGFGGIHSHSHHNTQSSRLGMGGMNPNPLSTNGSGGGVGGGIGMNGLSHPSHSHSIHTQQLSNHARGLDGFRESDYLDNLGVGVGVDLELDDEKLNLVNQALDPSGMISASASGSGPGSMMGQAGSQVFSHGDLDLDASRLGVDMDLLDGGLAGGDGGGSDREGEGGEGEGEDGEGGAGEGEEEGGEVDNEEPLYVNAKQYHRILKRRMARARLEELNRLSRSRKVCPRPCYSSACFSSFFVRHISSPSPESRPTPCLTRKW